MRARSSGAPLDAQTAYDLLRIGAWARDGRRLLVITRLSRYWRSGQRERSTP
jgi:hypothetical protein